MQLAAHRSAQGSGDWGLHMFEPSALVKQQTIKFLPVFNAWGLARLSQDQVSGGLAVVK